MNVLCSLYFNENYSLVLREPSKAMDRFRLIAEIRKRPALWDFQCIERSRLKIADLWREVASGVGAEVTVEACKGKWKHLRDAYRTEMRRSQHRIDRDIRKGKYDPNKDYGSKWVYFDHMKFVDIGTKPRIKGYKSNDNDSDHGSNLHSLDNTEMESDIGGLYHVAGEQRNKPPIQWQSHLGPPPLRRLDTVKRISSLNESDLAPCYSSKPKNTYYQINFLEDSDKEELLMRSTVANRHGSEDKSCSNETNDTCKQYAQLHDLDNMCIKVEPDIEIEADIYPMDNEDSNESHGKQYRKDNSLKSPVPKRQRLMDKNSSTPKQKCSANSKTFERSNLLNVLEKDDEPLLNNAKENCLHSRSSIGDFGDPDNNFLISFSSHMKSMSQLQNLQFRAKMSELILNILSTSSFANAPNKQETSTHAKALADITDPDCNFLISFLPYVKSMCQLQNLQFRAKMSDLMLNILSTSLSANTLSDSTTEEGASNNN